MAHRYAHGQGPQQHPRQGGQAEEALGVGQGFPHLGALIIRLDQLLSRRQLGLEPALIAGDPLAGALEQIAPLLAAARQQGTGRLDVGAVDQGPWRHLEGAEALIRLLPQLPRDFEPGVADLQLVPELGAEQLHHPGGEPDLAGRGRPLRHQLQLAIEGEVARHGPDGGQLQPIPVKQHAVEADRGLDGEAILPGLLEPGLGRRGRGAQHPIGADEVTARGLEPGIQPVRHQRHAQHAGHTQRQRQHEPAQLAAETLAAQQLESQSPLTHD
ncbi:hypothetical protein D3C80_1183280 [compost metagenome]